MTSNTHRRSQRALALATLLFLGPATVAHAECSNPNSAKYFGQWLAAQGTCMITNAGTNILTTAGKGLASSLLDAAVPGASVFLGLSDPDKFAQWGRDILKALNTGFYGTDSQVYAFWNWAMAQQNANINRDYNAVKNDIQINWFNKPMEQRINQVGTIAAIVSDLESVRQAMSLAVTARDRIMWLQEYTLLVDLELQMEAEEATASVLNAQVMYDSRYHNDLAAYYAAISPAESARLISMIDTQTVADWRVTLETGTNATLTYLSNIGNDYQTIATQRVGNMVKCTTGAQPPWAFNPLPNWVYTVDHGVPDVNGVPQSACVDSAGRVIPPSCSVLWDLGLSHGSACDSFNIVQNDSTHFEGVYDGTIAASNTTIMNQHRWSVRGDMLVEGYGPVIRKLDLWWHMIENGPRPQNTTDQQLQDYMFGLSPYTVTRGSAWGGLTNVGLTVFATFGFCLTAPPDNVLTTMIGLGLENGSAAIQDLCTAYREDSLSTQSPPYSFFRDGVINQFDFHSFFKSQFAAKEVILY